MSTATATLTSLDVTADLHVPLTLTVLDPISHGAGTSGNTQLLRTQPVLLDDSRRTSVPYVSSNSVRHTLRAALAWHLVRTLGLPAGNWSKRVVDLLWSGGALTSTGNQADLTMMRRVDSTLPGVSAMGYSAKSDIVTGTLYVDNFHLVCAENRDRVPARLRAHPHVSLPAGAMRGEAFGTRHDVSGTPVSRLMDADLWLGTTETTQMIYDMQVINPGTVLYSGLHLYVPTVGHRAALAVAVDEAAPDHDGDRIIHLGGKRAVGFGRCRVDGDLTPLGDIAGARAEYEAHLHAHRDTIVALLPEIVG